MHVSAQQEGNIWHFYNAVGLSVANGEPVFLPESSQLAQEGCASYCDENGELLFYTNGGGRPDPSQNNGTIWNRNHEVMYDMGGTEGGGISARQSSLIVPHPGQPDQYYLFTMEEIEFGVGGPVPGQPEGRGLSYFLIDMTLNGGLGGVVDNTDTRLFVPSFEQLSGTIAGNGTDYWVICTQNNLDVGLNRFVYFRVTATDIEGPFFQDIPTGQPLVNQIKISPDGRWIFCGAHMFGFDKFIGAISNPFADEPPLAYSSATFTADSRYVYYINSQFGVADGIFRVELTPEFPREEVYPYAAMDIQEVGSLQLGPCGHIFQSEIDLATDSLYITRIRFPAAADPVVERRLVGRSRPAPLGAGAFLPNFTDHIFEYEYNTDTTELALMEVGVCIPVDTTLSAPFTGTSYLWNTGATTADLSIDQPGTYTVTVTDICNTVSTATFEVSETQCTSALDCDYALPDTFTPNGDGTNDTFGVFSNCMERTDYRSYTLSIYSRWGQLVYSSDDPTARWDGLYEGEPAPSDVYVYQLGFQFADAEEVVEEEGWVSLVR